MIILTLTCRLPLRVTRRGIGKKLNKARTEYRHSRSRSTCDSCDRSSWISHLGDETYCRANSDNPAFHDVQRTLLSFCTCLLCSFVLRVRSFTMLSAGFFVFLQFLFPRFFFPFHLRSHVRRNTHRVSRIQSTGIGDSTCKD